MAVPYHHVPYRVLTFCAGALLVLLVLMLFGRVAGHGPGCNMGLLVEPSPTYNAYASTTYGWPFRAVTVEQIACQGPPEEWAPKTSVVWHPLGLVVSLLQLLVGGIVLSWSLGRRKKGADAAGNRGER
jgi:hypothetical protein